ncbi:MAG: hypothetical protein GXO21_05530 [Aquificae bacterium]|nr:hypothetical protein [Aquificota bacterium]
MNIKIYTVASIQEGWKRIKEELGEDAIILSIKELNGIFEIIATSPNSQAKEKVFAEELIGLKNFVKRLEEKKIEKELKKQIEEEVLLSYGYIVEKYPINIEGKIELNPLSKKYIFLFGNVSSGKSITVVKLASLLKFEKQKKVCIASFDFYKIGGSESLLSFANIMQIPFFQIKSEKDLILHKDYLDEFEHIIFDTPGNIKDLKEIEKFIQFISKSSQAENILVLPLTKKETLLDKDVQYFSKFNIHHLILTKYDQIENKLPLYYVLGNFNYPVSYITNGVDVPQDIFHMQKLVEERVI